MPTSTDTTRPYEVLFRWAEDGTLAGHVQLIREVRDDATNELLTAKELPPVPLATAGAEFDDVMASVNSAVLAERDSLAADKTALTTERDALAADKAALTTERDTLEADLAALIAERDALVADLAAMTAERDALAAQA